MARKWWGFAAAYVVLAFLAGCAVGKNLKQESAADQSSVTEVIAGEELPAIRRLEDGRQGFVIRERASLDGEWSEDFERAVDRMRDQDYQKAIELLEKVIEQSPGVTPPYINLGICYARTGKPDQAERYLQTALELLPDHPVASNEYGMILRKKGRFAEARAIYEKGLATFPEYLPMHRNLGILCDLYLNDPACALEQYEIYSEARPEDEQVKRWLAELRLRSGGE